MKKLYILIATAMLLLVPLSGCLPLMTLFGFRVVDAEMDEQEYIVQTEHIFNEWLIVIDDWENNANNPQRHAYRDLDAEECSSKMAVIISAWKKIEPPQQFNEHHTYVLSAMAYEQEAFDLLKEYYQLNYTFEPDEDELSELNARIFELWGLKDEALAKAIEIIPVG